MNYKLFLPETPIIDNDDFVVYANPINISFSKDMMDYLLMKKQEILNFFGIDSFRKVQINIYDTKQGYMDFSSQFFTPSKYSKGNFANGMLNLFVSERALEDENKYRYRMNTAAHEFVHIVYKEEVQEKGENKRVVWLDEGLAEYLSGSYANSTENVFKNFLLKQIIGPDKIIPNIEFLKEHGSEYGKFCDKETDKYNGYHLSYLMIRYLVETMEKDDFQKMIRNKNLIEKIGENVLNDAVTCYSTQLEVDYELKRW